MSAIVLIGPAEALHSLRKQFAADSAVQTFSHHDVRAAVEFMADHPPDVVALEESFAVSPRGEALVARVIDDPSLARCHIRILTQSGAERERTRRPAAGGAASGELVNSAGQPLQLDQTGPSQGPGPARSPQLDQKGTRRVPRVRIVAGVAITIDGNPAELVDLSPLGAQVVSRIVLRPNQRVRLQLPEGKDDGRRPLRCAGSVVWASFEMPPGEPPRYRAGLKISGIEAEAISLYAERHRADAIEPAARSDQTS